MSYQLEFSIKAKKDLKKLPKREAFDIKGKMDYYLNTSDPLVYAKPIKDLSKNSHNPILQTSKSHQISILTIW